MNRALPVPSVVESLWAVFRLLLNPTYLGFGSEHGDPIRRRDRHASYALRRFLSRSRPRRQAGL